jgi:pyrimidine oxygenase
MGLWPGEEHFKRRYDYLDEYVHVVRDLWETGQSDFKGQFFTMNDCRLSPRPSAPIKLVCAGQSDRGMQFAAEQADFSFVAGTGLNMPVACTPTNTRLRAAAASTGRDVGSYVLFMVIADETDERAMAKWEHYKAGADVEALAWLTEQSGADAGAAATSTARQMSLPESAVNFNMGTLIGSYAAVARMLDEVAEVPGIKGIMLTFDDFLVSIDQFGQRIQPLMRSREAQRSAA